LNDIIKPFQSAGQMGQRDIHTVPLELPIPPFDPENTLHRSIAGLAGDAAEKVKASYESGKIDGTLAKRRELAREAVRVEIDTLNKAVAQLLSDTQGDGKGVL